MNKSHWVLLFSLIVCQNIFAQREFWGMGSQGGEVGIDGYGISNPGGGVIFKTDSTGRNLTVVHEFDTLGSYCPCGTLTQALNGKLYGLTSSGNFTDTGAKNSGSGCLFEFDPITNQYRVIKNFFNLVNPSSSSFGVTRGGTLLLANSGVLYGIRDSMWVHGAYHNPILFEYNPATDIYRNLVSISNQPIFSFLIQASNKNLYFTSYGSTGINMSGYLYEYNLSTNKLNNLYNFIDTGGSLPYTGVMEYSPGLLYGTFCYGHSIAQASGGIFEYNLNNHTYSQKAQMDSIAGLWSQPYSPLLKHNNKLYSTTQAGGLNNAGILFEYDPVANKLRKVKDLYDTSPYTTIITGNGWGLTNSRDGKIYGLSDNDLFSYDPVLDTLTGLVIMDRPIYKNNLGQNSGGELLHPYYAAPTELCFTPRYTAFSSDTISAVVGHPISLLIHTPNTNSFVWSKNGKAMALTDSTLRITKAALTDSGTYICQLTNGCGTVSTKAVKIIVSKTVPLGIISFTALAEKDSVLLRWQTTETGIGSFIVERSGTGQGFVPIGNVNAIGSSFSFMDNSPLQTGYYRIKQIDKDGAVAYSKVVSISLTTYNLQPTTFSVYPNPSKDRITIVGNHISNVEVVDNMGKVVRVVSFNDAINPTLSVGELIKGIYHLRVQTTDGKESVVGLVVSD